MSRLDSFIRRLEAQRACLNAAAAALAGRSGVVLELGLGNGRTYDHLREVFADHEIYVFERQIATNLASRPDEAHLFLGDFQETLPQAAERLGATVILAHGDFGSGDPVADGKVAAVLAKALAPLMAPGAWLISDQNVALAGSRARDLPQGVKPGRYFIREMAS